MNRHVRLGINIDHVATLRNARGGDTPKVIEAAKVVEESGADLITVHVELEDQVSSLLWKIRSLDKQVGLAINPPTAIEKVKPFLEKVDLLLVMTVNPGFGGQSFIEECVPKIQQVYEWRETMGLDFRIEVDGGVDLKTAAECARAGANTFVAGSALFGQRSLTRAVKKMHKVATQVGDGYGKLVLSLSILELMAGGLLLLRNLLLKI